MACYGIRGAVAVETNEASAIVQATREMLEQIVARNAVAKGDVVSMLFTSTPDLDAAYPARAAREMGCRDTPLLCAQEMKVPDSLPRCIRVLVLVNSARQPDRVHHVYLGDARTLRPDWTEENDR